MRVRTDAFLASWMVASEQHCDGEDVLRNRRVGRGRRRGRAPQSALSSIAEGDAGTFEQHGEGEDRQGHHHMLSLDEMREQLNAAKSQALANQEEMHARTSLIVELWRSIEREYGRGAADVLLPVSSGEALT